MCVCNNEKKINSDYFQEHSTAKTSKRGSFFFMGKAFHLNIKMWCNVKYEISFERKLMMKKKCSGHLISGGTTR